MPKETLNAFRKIQFTIGNELLKHPVHTACSILKFLTEQISRFAAPSLTLRGHEAGLLHAY